MKDKDIVKNLIAQLKEQADSDFELYRISVLESDLFNPPKPEIIDENHQKFTVRTYSKHKNTQHFGDIHRAVYEYYRGEIPPGYIVHHDDLDKSNNDISNLVLKTKVEHTKLHNDARHMKKMCDARKVKTFTCANCGKEFTALDLGTNKYCSNKCASHFKYMNTEPVTKTCPYCGNTFETLNKKQIYCSRKCANLANVDIIIANLPVKPAQFGHCKFCNKEFKKIKTKQKFCSHSCAKKYYWKSKKN